MNLQDGQDVPHGIVISQPLATDFFPEENAIDKTVVINETEFRVIGVLGAPADTTMEVNLADVYIDLNPQVEPNAPAPVQQLDHKYPTYPLDRIWIKVSRLSEIESTKKIVEQILHRNHPGNEYSLDSDFNVED